MFQVWEKNRKEMGGTEGVAVKLRMHLVYTKKQLNIVNSFWKKEMYNS